ncbi:GTP cyclohydrolase IIa [Pyrobaculum neutrophilum]|uniref:GTP cyclohydrolase III n=1 Tax=Pyrobaculum neutrophilum (strain DSM 2338 / JCM 9278 / NBRC 100436 / V24Sta) TaxID=444157 RepID=GCH3_PYRNV|nr:GTP cyclohydrolase IIa [Pyrobaculum neutrophilum]B1YAW1.1 RecName: Full=GTP cyclohydrolase III [Pyrobaculum neutrophilum V24Sta]ACB40661.1 GTP cyclohydrolase IIa [Pyrobaculum neutrophilum V24Sta]
MHGVVVVELKGYREWTESLGPRREHIIQQVQSRIQAAVWRSFTAVGALPHHFRYDFYIALVNGVSLDLVKRAVEKAARASPVGAGFCLGVGETPYEAYLRCGGGGGGAASPAVVAHMDVINSTEATRRNGPLDVYLKVVKLLGQLGERCKDLGCMAFYLGGDNIALFLPSPNAIYSILDGVDLRVRVGVGVAKRPYNAFVRATWALDRLRSAGREGVEVVK